MLTPKNGGITMCTSLFIGSEKRGKHSLFGRNMDIEAHFGETVVITPRAYPFHLRCLPDEKTHYAIIGMATIREGFPLYADAMNEKGLCMSGLHFPGNAVYTPREKVPDGIRRVAPFELVPYLLGTCGTVQEVKAVLQSAVIVDVPFSNILPNTPLHWHIAAPDGAVILEAVADGLRIYDDTVGVLTNNPPYPFHVTNLRRYAGLSENPLPEEGSDRQKTHPGETYDLGVGLVGLPGDATSPARFVRCATLKRLTAWESLTHNEALGQFFRLLGAVAVPYGVVLTKEGACHATRYSCCMDTETMTYHVLTDQTITPFSVTLTKERCEGELLWKAHP